MGIAKSFRDLRVYQLARKAVGEIFAATNAFPREERYELTDQIRRSARATKALIAEGWARRRYKASDFCKYSSDTDYREIVNEEPSTAEDLYLADLDEATP